MDMFNDTPRRLDDKATIHKPEFEKHIPDIYSRELQLNKANTSNSGSDDVPRLPSYGIYISQLVRFARRCTN